MQAAVNVSHTDSRSGRADQHHLSRLFKPFNRLMPILQPVLLICMLVSMAGAQSNAQRPVANPTNPATSSAAQKSFEKMKALVGSWQGTVMGMSINFTIRLASSGTAILHEGNAAGGPVPDHEITMFYLDGDRLLATHYCDAGNRSRMEGKLSPDGKKIDFSFLDVSGGTRRGFLRDIGFTIIDADRHTVELTFIMPDGKPIQARGEFQRTK